MHYADLTDVLSMENIIQKYLPDEIYNLGAQSHVRVSFDIPEYTSNVNGLGALRILEIIKRFKNKKKLNFTKLQLLNYMEDLKKNLKMKTQDFIQSLHMLVQNYLLTGLL